MILAMLVMDAVPMFFALFSQPIPFQICKKPLPNLNPLPTSNIFFFFNLFFFIIVFWDETPDDLLINFFVVVVVVVLGFRYLHML